MNFASTTCIGTKVPKSAQTIPKLSGSNNIHSNFTHESAVLSGTAHPYSIQGPLGRFEDTVLESSEDSLTQIVDIDANCWLRLQLDLGLRPEHLHLASPCSCLAFAQHGSSF